MASAIRNKLRIGMIPADGIGKEVLPAAQQVLQALSSSLPKLEFVPLLAGWEVFQKTGSALPEDTVQALKSDTDAAIFGSVSSPSTKVEGYSSPIVALRKRLDLYANVRPVVSVPGQDGKKVNMVIVRENTECLYVKSETIETLPDGTKKAIALRQITERASDRIGRMAFEIALKRGEERKLSGASGSFRSGPPKVTIIHKSNVLSVTDGLFRETVRAVREKNMERYEGVVLEEQIVDSMVYKLFREPEVFDVTVAPNLYGDIISDGAAALVGSLGVVPSINAGDSYVMGEPVHGSAPDIEGKGIANPIATIRSAALLLSHLGYSEPAARINQAVNSVLLEGRVITPDLGGKSSTTDVVDAVLKKL